MSEIRVTTLKDTSGSNSSTTAQIASGRAKAWVNFNGESTVAIRANFNVNSITDHGVGDYTVSFTTAMSDANYSINGTMSVNAHTAGTIFAPLNDGVATGSVRVIDARGPGQTDRPIISVAIFR